MAKRSRRMSIAICFVFVVLGTRSLHAQTQPDRWTFGHASFPATIDTFVVATANRWPDDSTLGVLVKYVSPIDNTAEFDVFLYPVKEPRSTDSATAAAEFEVAVAGIRQYANTERESDEVTVDEERVWPVDDSDGRHHVGHYAAFTFKRGNQRRRSLVLVFARDGQFLKFRITHQPALRRVVAPYLERFVQGALALVKER